jgi:hypothetical protein
MLEILRSGKVETKNFQRDSTYVCRMNLTWTPYLPLRTQIIELDMHMRRQIYAYNKLLYNHPL